MALLALHFSRIYKEKLLNGKRHTMVDYPLHLAPGQKLLVYISDKESEEESTKAEKFAIATITKIFVIAVKNINNENAKLMGHKTKKEVIDSLRKWYKINNKSVITYLEFEVKRG